MSAMKKKVATHVMALLAAPLMAFEALAISVDIPGRGFNWFADGLH
jgi:hypothetical protein